MCPHNKGFAQIRFIDRSTREGITITVVMSIAKQLEVALNRSDVLVCTLLRRLDCDPELAKWLVDHGSMKFILRFPGWDKRSFACLDWRTLDELDIKVCHFFFELHLILN